MLGITSRVNAGEERRVRPVTAWAANALAAFVVAFGAMSCSVTVDSDRPQCQTDADCASRGAAFAEARCVDSLCVGDPRWACMDREPTSTPSGPFTIGMKVTDLVSHAPIAGLSADLCRKVDVVCADPVTTVNSDGEGKLTFDQVEANFSGYVSLSAEGIVPTLYFFNPPVASNLEVPSLSLSTPQSRTALLGQLGADTKRGDLLLNVVDCDGSPASGISFTLSPEGTGSIPFYLSSGLPTRNATATDATGYGGFVNVPAGTVTIRAVDAKSQRVIQTLTLVVRDGAATWSKVVPDGS
jgi:hypothetical protein